MSFFKSSKRAPTGQPNYEPRLFLTTDARQNAFDDNWIIPTRQSGLAGLRPLFDVLGAETPSGFDYMTNLIGLGGTPSPVAVNQPLINNPAIAQQFIEETQ